MHDCPCCGEAVYSDDEDDLCSCCIEAGCEPSSDGVYYECEIPMCPACETRQTFCTDGKWHSNCDDEAECAASIGDA